MTATERSKLVAMLVAAVLGETTEYDAVELAEALDERGVVEAEYQAGLRAHYLAL